MQTPSSQLQIVILHIEEFSINYFKNSSTKGSSGSLNKTTPFPPFNMILEKVKIPSRLYEPQ